MKKQAHILFTGTVQGVGFRFTARHLANRYGLTGWAKNMFDGSVEVVAEGEEDRVKLLIDSLNEQFKGYVTNTEVTWADPTDEFSIFDIRF